MDTLPAVVSNATSADRAVARRVLLIVAGGLLTGILTLGGQAVLDGDFNRLANSGAIWLTVAFALGATMPTDRRAAAAGFVGLLLALVGYFASAAIAGAGISTASLVIWGGTAIVGGPPFGVAGRWWRREKAPRPAMAAALLGAVYIAEGAYTLLAIPHLTATGSVEVGLGVAISLVLLRSVSAPAVGLVLLAPLSAAGVLAYMLINRLFLF